MFVTRASNRACDSVLALVYPQACAICGGSVESRDFGVACFECWGRTRIFSDVEGICWKCGIPAHRAVSDDNRTDVRCRRCETEDFQSARSCGVYEGALRASVLALKHTPRVASRLVQLLCEFQKRSPLDSATLIVPVPLHPEREKARGFNQAAVLGRALSHVRGLPIDESSLIRTHHTDRHRAGMDAKDRRRTVADAFGVEYPDVIRGERVLLVDDVFTTGATVSSCARALLAAGAAEVSVLTIARPLARGYKS